MKTLSLALLIIISVFSISNAQFTKVGGGLTYGTGFHFNNETTGQEADLHKGPNLGIFITGIYELNLPFHLAPSFTYFFPRTNEIALTSFGKTRVSDKFEFYGLAGLNVTLAKLKWLGPPSSYGSDNALGLNIGAGTYMKMTEKLDLYGEVKYIISKYDQLMINAGVLFNMDWMKKHENDQK